MIKNYAKQIKTCFFSAAFVAIAAFSVNAQTSTGTQTFSAQGNDDAPVTININTSSGLMVNQGMPIQSIIISDFFGGDAYWEDEYDCGDYYAFSLNVDGVDIVVDGCSYDLIGEDLTGASVITITSSDLDGYSDLVKVELELEVVYDTPTCPFPINVVVDALTSSSADFSWDAGGTETSWNVEWGLPGFASGSGIGTQTVSSPSVSIPGLVPSTVYEIHIVADCGSGDMSFPLSAPFTTACGTIPAIGFCEGFEIDSPTRDCWSIVDANGDGYDYFEMSEYIWYITSNYDLGDVVSHTGEYSAGIYTDFSYGDNDDYLITPHLTLTGNEVLTFYYRSYYEDEPNDFRVLLSTTGNAPGDFTEVIMPLTTAYNEEHQLASINLSAYTGDVYIAFHVPPGGEDGLFLSIDDVCIDICTPNPGTDGEIDVCRMNETVDLNTVITSEYTSGNWVYTPNQSLINGSVFNISTLIDGSYEVNYIVTTGCTPDTTVATINVARPFSAGENGTITACKNQMINLHGGLSGNVDYGGIWYAPDGTVINTPYFQTGTQIGQAVYKYVVNNGVCDADTAEVLVNVQNCDFLGLDDMTWKNVSLYPNPNNGLFMITGIPANKTFKIEVSDLNGRMVRTFEGVNSSAISVDLNDMRNGVYLVRISGNEVEKTIRVIKQ